MSRPRFLPTIPSFRSLNPAPVGALFIVAMLTLLYFAFTLQNLPFIKGTTYTAAFSEAAGLRKGDKVRVAGIDVGQVDQVKLENAHVQVRFSIKNKKVRLGEQTTASIQIFTLLGNKYIGLEPKGPGKWSPKKEIPLSHTSAPYDVSPAFQDVSKTVQDVDKTQLAQAFDTISETFKNSPQPLKSTLSGMQRLSQTIASRDDQLGELLQHLSGVTGVLAQRRGQLVTLIQDGDKLLTEIDKRRDVITQLLNNTSALAIQLKGLVADNNEQIKPALAHLQNVVDILDKNQKTLDETLTLLYPTTRNLIDVVGSGGWYDATIINATSPFTLVGGKGVPSLPLPTSLSDLLGIDGLVKAVGK